VGDDHAAPAAGSTATAVASGGVEPFHGRHQAGISTPPQLHTHFVALDVTTDERKEVVGLLRRWTRVGATLAAGDRPGAASGGGVDSGEALGLPPARLTVNFGFGPGLFATGGDDRFGLRSVQPWQLVELPPFPGDALESAATGGDLSLHVCADDPQVVFHAVRSLVRAAEGVARVRWAQPGFNETAATEGTPRNLMGFKDGTLNPATTAQLAAAVWVGAEGPDWMTGGTYLVVRRIRMDLAAWDALGVSAQERVIGRHKVSGAPLGAEHEADPLRLSARTAAGDLVIPADAHVRLASPAQNWDSVILRRSYSYANPSTGAAASSGPGPPEPLDAGLLFFSYQRNPRLSFVPIYRKLSANDALRRFTVHTASAIFALPSGVTAPGRWVGAALFA